MKFTTLRRGLALLLALCLAPSCAGCGGSNASSMFLQKTEGVVSVCDAEGKDVAPAKNLGLYSGYGVGTQAESYAWIELDKTKLAKLDENSEAAIEKEGKSLSIEVKTGSLFFNVTRPLADDERMEIRSSSMIAGIRGTCGWVEIPQSGGMCVYILEGAVECTAGGNTAAVRAGERAALTADGEITVERFSASAVPAFVAKELEADKALSRAVQKASGIDLAAYSPAACEEFLSTLENVVSSELIDFEADGSPELLVFTELEKGGPLWMLVYRIDPEDPKEAEDLCWAGGSQLPAQITWSLVQTADGRQYIHMRTDEQFEGEGKEEGARFTVCQDWYFGSVAAQNGGSEDWGAVDLLYGGSLYSASGEDVWVIPHDDRGLADVEQVNDILNETEPDPALAQALQSKYSLVRELFVETR